MTQVLHRLHPPAHCQAISLPGYGHPNDGDGEVQVPHLQEQTDSVTGIRPSVLLHQAGTHDATAMMSGKCDQVQGASDRMRNCVHPASVCRATYHACDEAPLLVVFLAKACYIRLHNVEQLGHHLQQQHVPDQPESEHLQTLQMAAFKTKPHTANH